MVKGSSLSQLFSHVFTKTCQELRFYQSMEWTGSIRWIDNPVQSRWIWIGLDQKFTNSADSGLDWIQKCAMCIPYLDLRQFLLVITLTSEVLPSNFQLFTSSFVFTCRFYKVFGRYLLCCVWIGLDWIQILVHQLDWTGLGSVARGFGLDWIVSTRSISYSGFYKMLHVFDIWSIFQIFR